MDTCIRRKFILSVEKRRSIVKQQAHTASRKQFSWLAGDNQKETTKRLKQLDETTLQRNNEAFKIGRSQEA